MLNCTADIGQTLVSKLIEAISEVDIDINQPPIGRSWHSQKGFGVVDGENFT